MEMKNVLDLLTQIEEGSDSEEVSRTVKTLKAGQALNEKKTGIKTVKENFEMAEAMIHDEDIRGQLLDAVDEGKLDARAIVSAVMKYMSPDDVADMLDRNEMTVTGDYHGDMEESEAEQDYFDAEGNNDENGSYDAGGNFDAEREVNRGTMDESWDDDDRRDDEENGGKFGSEASRNWGTGYSQDHVKRQAELANGDDQLDESKIDENDPWGIGEGDQINEDEDYDDDEATDECCEATDDEGSEYDDMEPGSGAESGYAGDNDSALGKINNRVTDRATSTAMADVQTRSQERPNYGVKAVKARTEARTDSMEPGDEVLHAELETMTANASIEEEISKSFRNPQERHTWMMQKLNQLRSQMTPEDSEMISSFMRTAGEAHVTGGNC